MILPCSGRTRRDGLQRLFPVLRINFGIGALFVAERSGIAIERAMRKEGPGYAEIALTGSGKAV